MGGGWEQGRSRPVLDDVTRETMEQRSKWKGILTAPLPAPGADAKAFPRRQDHEQNPQTGRDPGPDRREITRPVQAGRDAGAGAAQTPPPKPGKEAAAARSSCSC